MYKKLKEGKFIPRVPHVNMLRSRDTRDQHRVLVGDKGHSPEQLC